MSSAVVSATQSVEESNFISSLMQSGDVFEEPLQNTASTSSKKPKKSNLGKSVIRDSLVFRSTDYTVPIHQPNVHSSNPNLFIEVTKNQELQGVVVCDLEFICDNIPVIRNKYKPSNGNTFTGCFLSYCVRLELFLS